MHEFRDVASHMAEVADDPETYSAPPPPLAPLEERQAAKQRILDDLVVVNSLDPTSPPFRELFAENHPADVLTMMKHAHGTLSGYENPHDYVVEFLRNADGDVVDYQIVPRQDIPPEELDRVLDKYRGKDRLGDTIAQIPDGPKKHAIVDAVTAANAAEGEEEDDIEVAETEDGYKFVSSDVNYQEGLANAALDSQLVEIGSSNTALDSEFKPPEYGDMAADSAFKVMQARRVVFEESPELLAARRDIMYARHKLHKHYRNEMTE
jgi:hypothetical protein